METSEPVTSNSITKKKSRLKIVRIASRIRNSPSISKREGFNITPKSNFPNPTSSNSNLSGTGHDDISLKLKNLSNNVIENMKDIDGNIENMYKMVNEYNEERDKVLTKREIQETLRNQFSFYKMSKEQESMIKSRKTYKNDIALLGSDFKMHEKDNKLDSSNEGSLIHVRNFLLETPRNPVKGNTKNANNTDSLNTSKDSKAFFTRRKFSDGEIAPQEKNTGPSQIYQGEGYFHRIELQNELRKRLIYEIEHAKSLNRIEERLLELKDTFIPSQFKKLEVLKSIGERKLMQKELTSRNYAHTVYYEILAMSPKKQELIQRRFSTFLPSISRYKTFNSLYEQHKNF